VGLAGSCVHSTSSRRTSGYPGLGCLAFPVVPILWAMVVEPRLHGLSPPRAILSSGELVELFVVAADGSCGLFP